MALSALSSSGSRRAPARPWGILFLFALVVLSALPACETEGITPDCPAMPAGLPTDPAVLAWQAEAARVGCLTAPAGTGGASVQPDQGGAGGAP